MKTATIAAAADTGLSHRRAGMRRRSRRDTLTFLAFVAPNFLLLAVFTFWPVVYSLYLSFFKWNMMARARRSSGWRLPDHDRGPRVLARAAQHLPLAAGTVFVKLAIALALAVS